MQIFPSYRTTFGLPWRVNMRICNIIKSRSGYILFVLFIFLSLYENMYIQKENKQAGTELRQDQLKLRLSKPVIVRILIRPELSRT